MTYLLKLLLPSWRLFDQPGDSCQVFFRQVGADISGPWIKITRPAKDRGILGLFLNPLDSIWLLYHSIVDQYCERISEDKEFKITQDPHFYLIQNFLRTQIINNENRKIPVQLKFEVYSENDEFQFEHVSTAFEC